MPVCVPMLLGTLLFAPALASETIAFYDANCALCHQKAGVGLTGQFPRLAGRLPQFAATKEGRRYLSEVVLFGMAGKLDIDGASIIGVMPSFAAQSDEDIASVLNYVISLPAAGQSPSKNTLPQVTAAEVAGVRSGPALAPGQVLANRKSVVPKGVK